MRASIYEATAEIVGCVVGLTLGLASVVALKLQRK